jgi:hypothetical protein
METGRMLGAEGGFPAEELQHRYGPFKPGDRVTYAGNGHIYCDKRKIGRAGTFVGYTDKGKCADVQFDGETTSWNVYVANLATETVVAKTVPGGHKPGDRVKVTIVGAVHGRGTDYTSVLPDGSHVSNQIAHLAEGVTIEVIEPDYKPGTVVKDANGRFWVSRIYGWSTFADSKSYSHDYPPRPLTVVS